MLSLAKGRLRWHAPDYTEVRGERTLLVWGDLPYWTVVDGDLHDFLTALDGQRGVGEIIDERPDWRAQRAAILAALRPLHAAGLFAAHPPEMPGPPLYGAKIDNIALNITRRCNLRCRFCYNLPYLSQDTTGEITAVEIIAFLRAVRPCLGRTPVLTVLGGEPLLDPDKLYAVARYAARMGVTTLVSTNGLAITDDIARRLRELRMQVQVSLDGPTARLHDAIRGHGNFDRAVAGVRTLVRAGAHTIISMVCHAGNVAHLEAYYRFARELGVNEARFIPLKRLGGATEGELTPVPLDVLLRHAFAMLTAHPEFLPLIGRDAFAILANTCRYSMRRASCGTGLQTVLLDADGALYPCLNTNNPVFRIANVRDDGFDFRRVWRTSPVLIDLRRRTVLHEPGHAHRDCPVRYWCLGGCRGENHALTGGLDNRPPHCAEQRRGIIEMCWMLADRPDLVTPAIKHC